MRSTYIFIASVVVFAAAIYFWLKQREAQNEYKLTVLDLDTVSRINQSVDNFNKKEAERLNNIATKAAKKAKAISTWSGIGAAVTGVVLTVATGGAAAPFIPLLAGAVTIGTNAVNKGIYDKANNDLKSSTGLQLGHV